VARTIDRADYIDRATIEERAGMADQSTQFLFCYLREKWISLKVTEGEVPAGSGHYGKTYECLDIDGVCRERHCRLSGEEVSSTREARDPWFDE
jgi:hypothetical protein